MNNKTNTQCCNQNCRQGRDCPLRMGTPREGVRSMSYRQCKCSSMCADCKRHGERALLATDTPPAATLTGLTLAPQRAGRIYVAGPMTGLPDLNAPAFNAAATELRTQGWHVENPADHGVIDGAEWADYLAYDLTRLGTCGAIYLLPSWGQSKGATLEAQIARALDMKFIFAPGAAIYSAMPLATRLRTGLDHCYEIAKSKEATYEIQGRAAQISYALADAINAALTLKQEQAA